MPTDVVRPGVNPLALAQHLVHSLTGRQHPIILAGFDRLVAGICDDRDDSGYDHIVVSAVLAIACAAHDLAFAHDEPIHVTVLLVTDHFRGTMSLQLDYVIAIAEYARTREPRYRDLIDCTPAALRAAAAAAAAWLCVAWADDEWAWDEDEIEHIERLWCDIDLPSHV